MNLLFWTIAKRAKIKSCLCFCLVIFSHALFVPLKLYMLFKGSKRREKKTKAYRG